MSRSAVLALALLLSGPARAADTGPRWEAPGPRIDHGDGARDGREGGETISSAFLIPALPFSDTGATCDNVNDYDEACPYTGAVAPDVVYKYIPPVDEWLDVDLCNSTYDTKVYVYAFGQGDPIACNDDARLCGSGDWYQARVIGVPVEAGRPYFVVVDGHEDACGTYVLSVSSTPPCVLECPEGAQIEGEPACVDGYYDQYNGGCSQIGWTSIEADEQGCRTVCGRSCTFLYQGDSYRDTDWYDCYAQGGTVTASCVAEFPLQFIFIYGAECNNLQYETALALPCETVTLTHDEPAGADFWLWVGPAAWAGVPESDYTMHVCGLVPSTPNSVRATSWGRIKGAF